MSNSDPQALSCNTCGNVGLADGNDGFFYCLQCGSQAEDIIDTGVADEDFIDKGGQIGGPIYTASHRRQRNPSVIKAEPISQSDSLRNSQNQSQFWASLNLNDDDVRTPNRLEVKMEEYDNDVGPFSDGVGPTGPEDFGMAGTSVPSFDDYCNEIRIRYVMGLQLMIESQCEALVREFKVSPLICGLAGTVWLRFVAGTRVFDDAWVDDAIQESEIQEHGEPSSGFKPRFKFKAEPHNLYGRRAVMIWFRSLRKRIPLSYSLAVSFLACHLAREAILPTDIVKWSLEGKLPYFAAFVEIENVIGQPSKACPISSSLMFRPLESITLQKLEAMAASIAESIGLDLPPVNFYAIASRYIKKLSLPVEKILSHACHIYEWSMPPDLWLSTNEQRLPTRVCVMSILIVAIRILYNIHGFGDWERRLSSHCASSSTSNWTGESDLNCSPETRDDVGNGSGSSPRIPHYSGTSPVQDLSHAQKSELNAAEILTNLEARYNEIDETYEYSKDLPTYLRFCKDVIFSGLEPSFEDHEEERVMEKLWDYYQNEKDSTTAGGEGMDCSGDVTQKILRDDEGCMNRLPKDKKKLRDRGVSSSPSDDEPNHSVGQQWSEHGDHSFNSSQGDQNSESDNQAASETTGGETTAETLKERAIRRMKLDMEENNFCYIPPRVNTKRFDYLHYVRKKGEGSLTYVAHADYYVLLRACARTAQVEIRCMHIGVLSFERRLAWLEHRINHCLHLNPPLFTYPPFTNAVLWVKFPGYTSPLADIMDAAVAKETDPGPFG
ncbi:hypothetical protein FNV43_RR26191 [Rhamnella rubrinervis]|uniref:Rrn7/TAF1B C-terminal cyclin domain-containing protein n=1 Tax=Rhamnella rubrinervis TaxID=2594499 RepID=A0A8K0DPC7_9ROSA|nr:hypothetical protein FNV43_RR26191 [Rhamnella rubrinervis]